MNGKTQTSCKEGRTELSKLRSTCTYYVRLFWGKLFLQHFSFFIIIFSFWVEDLNLCLTILWSFTEMRSTSPKNPSYGLVFSEDFYSHLFLDIEFEKKLKKTYPSILDFERKFSDFGNKLPAGMSKLFSTCQEKRYEEIVPRKDFLLSKFFWVFCQN